MKRVMILMVVLCVAVVSNTAFGTAWLTYSGTDLGGGLTGYTFTVSRDTPAGSFSTSNLVFTAYPGTTFGQGLVNGAVAIDDLSGANDWDGMLGYSKAFDTWYFDDNWGETAPNTSSFAGTTSIVLNNLITFAGVPHSSVDLIYIVADGNFSWTGGVAADGQIDDVTPWFPPPPNPPDIPEPVEPTTMSLLGLGGLALLRRRRR